MQVDGCRRALINTHYNDQLEQFCQVTDLACDFCHGWALVLEQTSSLIITNNQVVANWEAQLKALIDRFQNRCVICVMAQSQGFDQHWRHSPMTINHSFQHVAGLSCPNWKVYWPIFEKFEQWWGKWQSPKPDSCHY